MEKLDAGFKTLTVLDVDLRSAVVEMQGAVVDLTAKLEAASKRVDDVAFERNDLQMYM